MLKIAKGVRELIMDRMHLSEEFGDLIYGVLVVALIILVGVGLNWVIQLAFRWGTSHSGRLKRSRWYGYLVKRKVGHHLLMLVPGFIIYGLPHLFYERGDMMIRYLHRADIIYMLIVAIIIVNAVLNCFLDFYSTTDKNKKQIAYYQLPVYRLRKTSSFMSSCVSHFFFTLTLSSRFP
jgi:hypothetical protein